MSKRYLLSYYEQYAAFINKRYPFPFPDYVFEFHDEIDGAVLQSALEKAVLVHPAFKLTLREDAAGFYLEEVNAVPKVIEADWKAEFSYGQDGLMWVMSYTGKRLVFTAFHLLCDGMGAMQFLQDVLKYYFAALGKYSGELNAVGGIQYDESCVNGYREAVKATDKRWQDLDYDNLSELDFAQFKAMDDEPVLYRFDFAKAVIKQQAKESSTSTSAVISYYLAKAMADVLGKDEGKISVAVVADLRSRFPSKTDRNFTAESNLIYDIGKEAAWSRQEIQKNMRHQLDDFLKTERQQARIAKEHDLQQEVLSMSEEDKIANRNFLFQTFCTLRANICYSHLTNLGLPKEIEDMISDFHVAGAKGFSPRVCVFGSNLKEKITITVSQYLKEDSFVKALSDRLKDDEVEFQLSKLDLHGNMAYQLT